MDSVLTEFAKHVNILPKDYVEPVETETKSEKYIKDVQVDQTWVERVKTFTKAYVETLSVEEVEETFNSSDYSNLSLFVETNGLMLINYHYFKIASQISYIDNAIVQKCYQDKYSPKLTFNEFLVRENIKQNKDVFYRVTPSFPKIKLLELIVNLPLEKLTLPGSSFVDFLTLKELLEDEETAFKLMALGQSVAFWKIVDPSTILSSLDQQLKEFFRFSQIQLGISIDFNELKIYQEWIEMILDNIKNQLE